MRTAPFRALMRTLAVARLADARRTSSTDAIEQWGTTPGARVRRRTFLKGLGAAAAAAAAAPIRGLDAQSNVRVAVVGAGLAGLACADRLQQRGVTASVYEAAARPGGRCWSLRNVFPGQVVERGGEL